MAERNRNGRGKGRRAPVAGRTPSVGYVACRVQPGMFRGEYLVSFEALDPQKPGEKVTVQLLADERDVTIRSGTPTRHNPAEGVLRVEVVERKPGFALLVLPQPAQPVGERAYIEDDLLEPERVRT